MAKRILFIAAWTVTFLFGSAMFLGFASALFLAGQTVGGGQVSERTTNILATSWALIPMIVGLVGLLLGISGTLPGTRKQVRSADR